MLFRIEFVHFTFHVTLDSSIISSGPANYIPLHHMPNGGYLMQLWKVYSWIWRCSRRSTVICLCGFFWVKLTQHCRLACRADPSWFLAVTVRILNRAYFGRSLRCVHRNHLTSTTVWPKYTAPVSDTMTWIEMMRIIPIFSLASYRSVCISYSQGKQMDYIGDVRTGARTCPRADCSTIDRSLD